MYKDSVDCSENVVIASASLKKSTLKREKLCTYHCSCSSELTMDLKTESEEDSQVDICMSHMFIHLFTYQPVTPVSELCAYK